MRIRHCGFALLVLFSARPALAHNPFGVEAILGYLFLSPFVMVAVIVSGIVVLKRHATQPISSVEVLVVCGLMILTSVVVLTPTFLFLAIASQLFYLNTSLFFLLLIVHFASAAIVPFAYYHFRRIKEQKADEKRSTT